MERTIARDHEELVFGRVLVNGDVGVGGDDLVLGVELRALLELKVAECPREREVSCSVRIGRVGEAASARVTITSSSAHLVPMIHPNLKKSRTIHSPKLDKASAGDDARVLARVCGLVVERHGLRLASDRENRS